MTQLKAVEKKRRLTFTAWNLLFYLLSLVQINKCSFSSVSDKRKKKRFFASQQMNVVYLLYFFQLWSYHVTFLLNNVNVFLLSLLHNYCLDFKKDEEKRMKQMHHLSLVIFLFARCLVPFTHFRFCIGRSCLWVSTRPCSHELVAVEIC